MSSLATASRNAVLRRYRQSRTAEIGRFVRLRKEVQKNRHMNVQALAISRNKDWMKRARGVVFGSGPTTSSERSAIMHEGDQEALDRYINENREELRATVDRMKEHAKAVERSLGDDAVLPLRNLQWLRWLDNNQQAWGEAMAKAAVERKNASVRISATDAYFPDCERLQPEPEQSSEAEDPQWLKDMLHQPPGFYTLFSPGTQPLVVFATTCQGCVWALQVHRIGTYRTAFREAVARELNL